MTRTQFVLDSLKAGEQISLLDADLYAEVPLDVYSWLRSNAPAYRDSNGLVWLSRHADVQAIERNSARYTSASGTSPLIDMSADRSMINLDDPDHAVQRRLVVRRFTPTGVRPHGEMVRARARKLFEGFAGDGGIDVVSQFSTVLPAMVIADLLGFGADRWADCRRWASNTLSATCFHWDDPRIGDFMTSYMEFRAAIESMIVRRRAEPGDDLISLWCHAALEFVDGTTRPMTDEEVQNEAILLLDGGAETSSNSIAFGLGEILRQPSQLALASDETLLGATGVEEIIRWVTPLHTMRRTATEAHSLHGVEVTAGDQIMLMYNSANRDPSVFDRPDSLLLDRASNHHLSFGFGTHYCLGANLARFEIRVALTELLRLPACASSIPTRRTTSGRGSS